MNGSMFITQEISSSILLSSKENYEK